MRVRCLSLSVAVTIAWFSITATAQADSMRMDQVLRDCFVADNAPEERQLAFVSCTAYVLGAFDMFVTAHRIQSMRASDSVRPLCLPPGGLTGVQILADLRQWTKEYPKDKAVLVSLVMHNAMVRAYGCKDSTSGRASP